MTVTDAEASENLGYGFCRECGKPFTAEEWDVHHTPNEAPLEAAHVDCCPDCGQDWEAVECAAGDDCLYLSDLSTKGMFGPETWPHRVQIDTAVYHPECAPGPEGCSAP